MCALFWVPSIDVSSLHVQTRLQVISSMWHYWFLQGYQYIKGSFFIMFVRFLFLLYFVKTEAEAHPSIPLQGWRGAGRPVYRFTCEFTELAKATCEIADEDTQDRPVMKCWKRHATFFLSFFLKTSQPRLICTQASNPKRGKLSVCIHIEAATARPTFLQERGELAATIVSDNCFRSPLTALPLIGEKGFWSRLFHSQMGSKTSIAFHQSHKPADRW